MKQKQMETVQDFGARLLSELEEAGKFSTAHVYRAVFHRLESYAGHDLRFRDLTPGFLKRFEQRLFQQNCKRNTVSLYLRMLRAAYNRATRAGNARRMPAGLFSNVFTGTDKAEKRALSLSTLSRLYRADLAEQPRLAFARDLFILSFYLRGIPFVDLTGLRKSDVSNTCIRYCRSKTGAPLEVDIEPCIRELLHRLGSGTAYLLPLLTAGDGRQGYAQYQSALRRYNRLLAQLSRELHLRTRLSSYVARHSWATLAYREQIPVAVISESLGHASEKLTYHYLAGFENRTLRDANRRLIALLQQPEQELDGEESLTKKQGEKRKKQQERRLKNEENRSLKDSLARLYERLNPLPLLLR
jgi:site-specific recombinase XerD